MPAKFKRLPLPDKLSAPDKFNSTPPPNPTPFPLKMTDFSPVTLLTSFEVI